MKIKHVLTLRYGIALSVIALMLASGHYLSLRQTSEAAEHGRLINISGAQRMLSQRIALLTQDLGQRALAPEDRQTAARLLDQALTRMESNHAALVRGWYERAESGNARFALRISPDGGLDGKIRAFIADSTLALETFMTSDSGAALRSDAMERIADAALNTSLLPQLEAVVADYEKENDAKIAQLEQYQELSFYAGLCILMLEILFVFGPMVRKISDSVQALDEVNEELDSFTRHIADDLRIPLRATVGLIKDVDQALESGETHRAKESSNTMLSTIIRIDSAIAELIEMVGRHRLVVGNFGKSKKSW